MARVKHAARVQVSSLAWVAALVPNEVHQKRPVRQEEMTIYGNIVAAKMQVAART